MTFTLTVILFYIGSLRHDKQRIVLRELTNEGDNYPEFYLCGDNCKVLDGVTTGVMCTVKFSINGKQTKRGYSHFLEAFSIENYSAA